MTTTDSGISINGRFLSQDVTGMQRYAHELLRALDDVIPSVAGPNVNIDILAPQNVRSIPQYRHFTVRRVGRFQGQVWEQLELPLYCKGKLLFTPCGGAPVLHSRHVIMIPDAAVVAVPSAYSLPYRNWYRWLHGRLIRKAEHIITISEFSKSELQSWYGASRDRITVTHLGIDHLERVKADVGILQRNGLQRGSYILGASSLNPSKNFLGLLNAFRILGRTEYRLVVAGGTAPGIFGGAHEHDPAIVHVGRVTDAELRALYENAACFVFPSYYEGFGLPPLEAISLGCPVVAARAASLPEVGGEAFTYCNPSDPGDIARAILSVLNDRTLHGQRRKARNFSWQTCAYQTWEILCPHPLRRAA